MGAGQQTAVRARGEQPDLSLARRVVALIAGVSIAMIRSGCSVATAPVRNRVLSIGCSPDCGASQHELQAAPRLEGAEDRLLATAADVGRLPPTEGLCR